MNQIHTANMKKVKEEASTIINEESNNLVSGGCCGKSEWRRWGGGEYEET